MTKPIFCFANYNSSLSQIYLLKDILNTVCKPEQCVLISELERYKSTTKSLVPSILPLEYARSFTHCSSARIVGIVQDNAKKLYKSLIKPIKHLKHQGLREKADAITIHIDLYKFLCQFNLSHAKHIVEVTKSQIDEQLKWIDDAKMFHHATTEMLMDANKIVVVFAGGAHCTRWFEAIESIPSLNERFFLFYAKNSSEDHSHLITNCNDQQHCLECSINQGGKECLGVIETVVGEYQQQ